MKVLERQQEQICSSAAGQEFPPDAPKVTESGTSLRCQLSPAAQAFLWSIQESRSYAPRNAIFRMGDPPEGIFLLESGEVALWLERPLEYPLLLRTASAGEALGLSACISGHPYEATAISVSRCEIAFVSTEHLARLVERFPDAWICIARFLTSNLSSAHEHVLCMRSAQPHSRRFRP